MTLFLSRLLAQTPPDLGGWATYGPLGLITAVLLGVCSYFIRRESARADKWEGIALRLLEANQQALKSNDSAHLSVTILEDLLRAALEQKK